MPGTVLKNNPWLSGNPMWYQGSKGGQLANAVSELSLALSTGHCLASLVPSVPMGRFLGPWIKDASLQV